MQTHEVDREAERAVITDLLQWARTVLAIELGDSRIMTFPLRKGNGWFWATKTRRWAAARIAAEWAAWLDEQDRI